MMMQLVIVTLISMPLLERVFQVDSYRGLVRPTAVALRLTDLRNCSNCQMHDPSAIAMFATALR